jgi:hypothetical protein
VVPKSKRTKWRFEVKNYVKQLDKVPMDGDDVAETARLIRLLYRRLCKGCGYYIFPSEDPFKAVGITQTEFYDRVVKRFFALDIDNSRIKDALSDATEVFLDRETLHWYMELTLIEHLRISDLKYKTTQVAMDLAAELEAKLEKESRYSDKRYYIQDD